jgi:hypothetical protein
VRTAISGDPVWVRLHDDSDWFLAIFVGGLSTNPEHPIVVRDADGVFHEIAAKNMDRSRCRLESIRQIGSLGAFGSNPDTYGNRYWYMTYICQVTGMEVSGKVSGGYGNIRAVCHNFFGCGDWHRGIQFYSEDLPIKEFNKRAKGLEYAGCTPDELQSFIYNKIGYKGAK